MSIQAVAWALEQDFSYVTPKGRLNHAHAAKLVLISLANHADHISGHCWPSGETIGREANVTPRGVYRIVADLERNGFIDIKRTRGKDGKQRSNNYWIRFDRKPAPWQYFGDPDDDPDDGGEPGDTESPGETVENLPENDSENATESPGPSDIRVTPQESLLEPSGLEPSVPNGFQPWARADEQARLKAAEEARKPKRQFAIKDTRPWDYWVQYGHPATLFTWSELHKAYGWYFPTLYPQPKQSTGPPELSLMSPEDHDYI